MTKINNTTVYHYDTTISEEDFLTGSDSDTTNKETKNYRLRDIRDFLLSGLSPEVGGVLKISEVVVNNVEVTTPEDALNAVTPVIDVLNYHLLFVNLNEQLFLFKKQNRIVGLGEEEVLNSDFIEFPVSVGPPGTNGTNGVDGVSKTASGTTTTVSGNGSDLTPYKVETVNLQKTISTFPYTILNADDKHTIIVNNLTDNVVINVPDDLVDSFTCVFVQDGTGTVTISETGLTSLKYPTTLNPVIKGRYFCVILEKYLNSYNHYLMGNLTAV